MRSPRPTRWIRWGRGRERREMMGEEGGEGRTPKLWLLRPWWFRPGSDFVFIFSLACEKVSLTFSLTLAYRSNHCIIGLPNISLSLRQIWLVFASKKMSLVKSRCHSQAYCNLSLFSHTLCHRIGCPIQTASRSTVCQICDSSLTLIVTFTDLSLRLQCNQTRPV